MFCVETILLIEAECRIYGVKEPSLVVVKPLSEPMMDYCYLESLAQTTVKSQTKVMRFHS